MTPAQTVNGPLILGATGLVGRALARVWPADAAPALWQHRPGATPPRSGAGLEWDILKTPLPELATTPSGMIVLAGVTAGDPAALALNTDLAQAAVAAARQAGIGRVLVASSQAVYGTALPRVSEATPCQPVSPYGRAKLDMEQALAGIAGVTLLRVGNVAGADSLLLAASKRVPVLDRFADGQGPLRSYIGPVTLARVLIRLLDPELDLPPVLNVASPGLVAMSDLLVAARQPFSWTEAPPSALPRLELDVARLAALVPLEPVRADLLIEEARQGGWAPRS